MADWDLQAVVRGYSTARNNPVAAATNSSSSNHHPHPVGDPFSVGIEKHEDPFCFPNLLDQTRVPNPFEELQEFYKPYFPIPTTTNLPRHILPASPISDLGGIFEDQNQHSTEQLEQVLQHQLQHQHQIQFQKPRATSALTIGPRPRRRKNQQKRVVCHVTSDNVTSDLWAWRKYGQKPIKGSPYPRNYYRCSSSKGCGARKQVERSPTDLNMFVVTYTGEHTHPRPTHRNSLAGSTRNKFSNTIIPNKPSSINTDPETAVTTPYCSSSPISSSSLSPTTPLTTSMDDVVELSHHKKNKETQEEEEDNDEEMEDADVDDDDDENLLIPNTIMSEDILMGFQELNSFQAKSVSPWAPGSHTAATGGSGGG
nr:WRKY [Loropetalum chinense var. rubrum]